MTTVLVSDTSILIDLERGSLLEATFACGLTLVVPDLLYERELEPENGAYLRTLGLGVVSLTPDEVTLAQEIRKLRPALSLTDCFALSCSLRPAHLLLTGDKDLRSEASTRGSKVHGILWLMDEMMKSGAIAKATLFEGLSRIVAHPKCRLPKSEVDARLDAWKP